MKLLYSGWSNVNVQRRPYISRRIYGSNKNSANVVIRRWLGHVAWHLHVCVCSFSCSENWHDPVQCSWLKKWIKKCDDDSETSNWIAANTRVRTQINAGLCPFSGGMFLLQTLEMLQRFVCLSHLVLTSYLSDGRASLVACLWVSDWHLLCPHFALMWSESAFAYGPADATASCCLLLQ